MQNLWDPMLRDPHPIGMQMLRDPTLLSQDDTPVTPTGGVFEEDWAGEPTSFGLPDSVGPNTMHDGDSPMQDMFVVSIS